MNLKIHKPELVQRVNAHIRSGQFHDADEVLEKALDALDRRPGAAQSRKPKKSAYGLLAEYGPGPTAEEIDENRREMFSSFGELAP
jgi:Arc/MetJ-type ribon-helix-helix transcriptional regulator